MKVKEKGKLALDTKGDDCISWNEMEMDAVLASHNPPLHTKMIMAKKVQTWCDNQAKGYSANNF
jgi:hypothetical protein